LGIASSLSFLFAAALALSSVLPCHVTRHRPHLRLLHRVLPFLVSFFLFAPTVVNLVLVLVWRNARSSNLTLRGRCHWSPDIVWAGVGGQCANHAPAFGVWLTAAILRLILTASILVRRVVIYSQDHCKFDIFSGFQVTYHIASSIYRTLQWLPSYRPEDIRRMDSVDLSHAPSRPSPVMYPLVHKSGAVSTPQRSLSTSRMAAIPEFSDTQHRYSQEHAGHDSDESCSTSEEDLNHRSTESSHFTTRSKSLRRTKSTRDARTGESSSSKRATHPSNPGEGPEGDLQGFEDRFRELVDQVSRELEESRIAERDELRTPPLHNVLDTHTSYMTIDEFGREVPSEEPVAILGGVIKRMPTIESVGSRELASIRSATLLAGGPACSSAASSRPPTCTTVASLNDAASASLASASQPSSRSNSLHRLRMPSELGELVRDALRARSGGGQSRALSSARPGSGGSVSGSGCTGESVGAPARSRSNSLGPNELLAPVTEYGELGRDSEDGLLRAVPPAVSARRLCDTPEQFLLGVVGAGEMGELVRAERSRSWAGSSHSATSTAYFSAGTSGSAGVDFGTGTGSNGGLR